MTLAYPDNVPKHQYENLQAQEFKAQMLPWILDMLWTGCFLERYLLSDLWMFSLLLLETTNMQ